METERLQRIKAKKIKTAKLQKDMTKQVRRDVKELLNIERSRMAKVRSKHSSWGFKGRV